MKYPADIYGVCQNNLKRKRTSKRISAKRLKIVHNPLNTLKRRFKQKIRNYYSKYHNVSDILTLNLVITIPKTDSVELLLINNKKVITSASEMLKWINQKTFMDYPINPYTNVDFTNDEISKIINIAQDYYFKNPLYKKYYETNERLNDMRVLYRNLNKSISHHRVRLQPERGLVMFVNILNSIYQEMQKMLWCHFVYSYDSYYENKYNELLSEYDYYLRQKNILLSNIYSRYYELH